MHPNLHPVRIKAGSLAPGCPSSNLVVSRQHRILVRSAIAERMFGEREILVPAIKLVGLEGVDVIEAWSGVEYFHILFDAHQIVVSNGAQTESLFTGPEALGSLPEASLNEIVALFPEIAEPDFEPISARLQPAEGHRVKQLVWRMSVNRKVPVEA